MPSAHGALPPPDPPLADYDRAPQLSDPVSVSGPVGGLSAATARWAQTPVAGLWPLLPPATNFWAVVSPGAPIASPLSGAVWAGVDISGNASYLVPPSVLSDNTGGNLFTARRLSSQRYAGDADFGAGTAAGVGFVGRTENWGGVGAAEFGAARYTNWAAQGSAIRYGIQVSLSGGGGERCAGCVW